MNPAPPIEADPGPDPVRARPPRSGRWLTWLGGATAVGLAVVSAVWEAFLTPVAVTWTSGGHAHSVRLPVALLCAIVGNAGLTWYTRVVTGRVLTVMLPFLAWTTPMLFAASRTREGDLVLTSNNWVGIGTMFAGAVTFAATAYWLALRSLRRPGDPGIAFRPTGR
ncbi:MAG: hypothetical protein QOI74_3842 [Micromonosporaceae bacterium]|jgi:hypothetical protein|nr:hypothetical protein [Micromonosporaceae bacterium]MDT5036853.1 hypothetical protein [Micromonosporaceae bacterium]